MAALRRMVVRVQDGVASGLSLEPEEDFALRFSKEQGLVRLAATFWGKPGSVLVSAVDSRGDSLEALSDEGRNSLSASEGWTDFGPLNIGERAGFLILPTPSSSWPITVRVRSSAGEPQEVSVPGV